jgi:hypothetical protein
MFRSPFLAFVLEAIRLAEYLSKLCQDDDFRYSRSGAG